MEDPKHIAKQLDAQIAAGGAAAHGPCVATVVPSAFSWPANPTPRRFGRKSGIKVMHSAPLTGDTGGVSTSFFPRLATVMLCLLALI